MKSNYLFPSTLKKIGWLLFIPGILLGLICLLNLADLEFLDITVFSVASSPLIGNETKFFTCITNNVFDEIVSILLIVGGILIAFSKEKSEDEFIAKIRMESLVWATYVNYIILLFSVVFVYDLAFMWVIVFNMFTVLIFFICRFNWALSKSKMQFQDEE